MADWTARRNANAARLAEVCRRYTWVRVPEFRCGSNCGSNCADRNGCVHAQYKFYAYVVPDRLAEGWHRDRIIEAVSCGGVPCYQGSCSEVYREKAFDATGWRPSRPLSTACDLGDTSLMFLVHPTLTDQEMARACDVLDTVLALAAG